jgi:hypothetical protein
MGDGSKLSALCYLKAALLAVGIPNCISIGASGEVVK